jgi:hypothetical protein
VNSQPAKQRDASTRGRLFGLHDDGLAVVASTLTLRQALRSVPRCTQAFFSVLQITLSVQSGLAHLSVVFKTAAFSVTDAAVAKRAKTIARTAAVQMSTLNQVLGQIKAVIEVPITQVTRLKMANGANRRGV